MTDSIIVSSGIAGVVAALLWLGILPYLQARKTAELNNEPIPSFSKMYLTSMIISSIGGFVSVFIVMSELEKSLASATTIISAASLGFSYTYTILGITNNMIDLKVEKTQLKKQLADSKATTTATKSTTSIVDKEVT